MSDSTTLHAGAPPGSSHGELERFFAMSLDMMCIAGADGCFKRVNPAFDALGYSTDELLSRPFLDFVHPDDVPATLAEVEKLAKGAPTIHFQNRYRCKDGSYRWLSWTSAPDPSGTLYAIARDVTDIHGEQEARKAADERLRLVVEALPNGLITVNAARTIVLVNRKAEELFGYSRDELVGEPIEKLLPERFRTQHHDHVRNFLAKPQTRGMSAGRDLFGRRKDGTEFPVEIGLNPIATPEGQSTVASIVDISERKRGEEARTRLAAIVTDSDDAIIGRTIDGIVTSWNRSAERIFGYLAEEMVGHRITVLFPPSRRDEEAQNTERLMKGERIEHFETVRKRKDGQEIDVAVTISSVRDSSGKLIGVSKTARDISELKRSQRELVGAKETAEAANRELESFSYSVAHDLRAPLRSIDGFSQALLEDCADKLDEDGRKYLRFVRESAQLMAQLIDDMLTLSRVTRSELAREKVDLSALARTTHARLERSEPGRGVEVAIEGGLEGDGDPRLLAVVFDNLLGNAWKFTSKRTGARVEVGTTTQNGLPAYFVRDNGAGFDMTYATKLFGVFQRLHAAHEFEGTGVGLATVQRIVHRHGGRVWAEGKVGDGATFYFTLGEKEREE